MLPVALGLQMLPRVLPRVLNGSKLPTGGGVLSSAWAATGEPDSEASMVSAGDPLVLVDQMLDTSDVHVLPPDALLRGGSHRGGVTCWEQTQRQHIPGARAKS